MTIYRIPFYSSVFALVIFVAMVTDMFFDLTLASERSPTPQRKAAHLGPALWQTL